MEQGSMGWIKGYLQLSCHDFHAESPRQSQAMSAVGAAQL